MAMQIHTLDLKFQGSSEAVAAFLVMGPRGPVLVETGPGSTLERLIAELARFGVQPRDVRDVLLTHIHLDHGGAAGWWATQGARVHVHHLGAPHLIDPSKLLMSAERIYGPMMKPLWGEYLAAPAEQVYALHDGDEIEAGGLVFTALDTPGHARHHLVYQLGNVAFTGDLAGIRLSARKHTRLPTPPPEFEREAWLKSIERVQALDLQKLYLTHFGALEDVAAHWANVAHLVNVYAEAAQAELERGAERTAIILRFEADEQARMAASDLPEEDFALYASIGPVGMSVDGLLRYWKKRLE